MTDDDRTTVELPPPESLAWYNEVFGDAPVIVALHRDGRCLYLNRAGQESFGLTSPDEVIGRNLVGFVGPEERSAGESGTETDSHTHAIALRLARCRRLDGTQFDVEVMNVPVTFGGMRVVQSIAIDVTERDRVARAFAQSEQKFATAFEASPDGIVIVRLDDLMIVNANPAWCALTGTSHEHVSGTSLRELPVALKPDERRDLLTRVGRDNRLRDFSLQYRRADSDEWRHACISAEVLVLEGARCLLAIGRDDTEERLLQARLRQSQKMDAVGQLAGGIAHDFNNLLTVIRANAELVIGDAPVSTSSQEDLNEILVACDRAATLTRQLLAFSRTQPLETKPFELNDALRTAGRMIARLLGPATTIDWQLGDVPLVLADRGQVEQILMNLLLNARDAMPDGGVITLETAPETVTESTFRAHTTGIAVIPGEYVRWTVTDHGVGMSAETKLRAFEPFFTTKTPGSGTGLGLATVYGIVKQSQGYIWLDSALGAGTAVHVYLPVSTTEVRG